MATVETIRRDIEKTREKISEQQKRLRTLEAQLTEEENLEIVRMVKAVKMDNRELTAFLKAYASGLITLPEGMMEAEAAADPGENEWRIPGMKNKKIIRLFTAALAVALCATAFAVPAFAGGGEGEPYYTETAGTEADPAEDAEAPEVTVTDEEDPVGDDNADNNTEDDGDALDQITELLGGLGTVTVTEDGILFTPDTEKWETQQTGTVTTCGGNLNVRTGAGLDNNAFTQLPDGAQVEVIGTEGEWVKVLLPEREGYVHSDYLTITDTGSFSLSMDGTDLSALMELFASGLSGGGGAALTPDGNLSLIDDLGGASSGKQFITVETKGGNVFYLIIDRDDEGAQTVHFLNQVDEADLLSLMEDGEAQEAPAGCTCTEKCQTGAVNTSCEVCAVNMAECAGAEPEPEPEPEPEEEKSGGMGALALVLALVVLGGGGAFAYIKFIRPKQASKASADPDDYDFADEEEYINEDEPEQEEETEETK